MNLLEDDESYVLLKNALSQLPFLKCFAFIALFLLVGKIMPDSVIVYQRNASYQEVSHIRVESPRRGERITEP